MYRHLTILQYFVGVLIVLFIGASQGVNAQAQCRDPNYWPLNGVGRVSPCVLASQVLQSCGSSSVPSLTQAGGTYSRDETNGGACACSIVAYNIWSACAACQVDYASALNGRGWIGSQEWNNGCSSMPMYPSGISPTLQRQLDEARWININYGSKFDAVRAYFLIGQPYGPIPSSLLNSAPPAATPAPSTTSRATPTSTRALQNAQSTTSTDEAHDDGSDEDEDNSDGESAASTTTSTGISDSQGSPTTGTDGTFQPDVLSPVGAEFGTTTQLVSGTNQPESGADVNSSTTSAEEGTEDKKQVPVAGIVVGTLAGVILLGFIAWFIVRRRRRQNQQVMVEKQHRFSGLSGVGGGGIESYGQLEEVKAAWAAIHASAHMDGRESSNLARYGSDGFGSPSQYTSGLPPRESESRPPSYIPGYGYGIGTGEKKRPLEEESQGGVDYSIAYSNYH